LGVTLEIHLILLGCGAIFGSIQFEHGVLVV